MREVLLNNEGKPLYLVTLKENGDLEIMAHADENGERPAFAIESKGKGYLRLRPIK